MKIVIIGAAGTIGKIITPILAGKPTQIDPLPPDETDPLAPFQIDPLIPAQIDPLKSA